MSSVQQTNVHPRPASPTTESDRPNKRPRQEQAEKVEQVVEQIYTKFEQDLIHANDGGYLPAVKRLALLVCKRQNVDAFTAGAELSAKSNFFAGVLLDLGNKNTVPPTAAEIAPLYDKFLASFDQSLSETKTLETLSVRWHVDYAPERDLGDILSAWHREIKVAREKVQGPELPMGWGVGFKCSYIAEKGCAKHADKVVDHDGSLLDKDPWKVFYKSENPADEVRALSLEPTIPQQIQAKFSHRQIIRQLGYTIEKDALGLAQSGNWGLVNLLVKEAPSLSHELGLALLQEAIFGKEFKTCQQLLKKGVSLFSSPELFFQMIREWDTADLNRILQSTDSPKEYPKILTDMAYHLALRYKNTSWDYQDADLFSWIKGKWIAVHFPNIPSWEIDREQEKVCSANFCKAFLQVVDQNGIIVEAKGFRKEAAESRASYTYTVQNEHIAHPTATPYQDESHKIADILDFTFEKNAKDLAESHNWGLVRELLERQQAPINKKAAGPVLSTARYAKQVQICKTIFAKGLPIHRKRNHWSDHFFDMVRDWDAKDLAQILEVVQPHPENPERFKDVAFSVSIRYRDRNFDAAEQAIFNTLSEIAERAMGSKQAFYAAIVHQIDDRKNHFKDKNFEKSLRDLSQT